MKDLLVIVYRSFNKILVILGLFLAGFTPVLASEQLADISMTSQTTKESLSDDSFDDTPDVEAYYKQGFENFASSSLDAPIKPNFSTKKYSRDDIILRLSLAKVLTVMIANFSCPEEPCDDWLREINARNARCMDLHIECRILPGAKKVQQTGVLRVVPLRWENFEEIFPTKIKKIKGRFAQHGIDLKVQFYKDDIF